YISVPGDANDRLRLGFVISNDDNTIIITDAGTYDIDAAIDNGSVLLVLEAHRDRTETGNGIWSDDASQIPGETTFVETSHGFDSTIIGQWLWPEPGSQAWWEIIDVDTDTITVSGDVPNLEVGGEPYTI